MTVSFSHPLIGGENLSNVHQEPEPRAILTDLPRDVVSFDQDAFDVAIHEHGVSMLHYRAMRCPIGMIDPTDIRKQHDEHAGCSHGFLYSYAGEIKAIFSGGDGKERQGPGGFVDDGSVSVTPPRYYEDGVTPFYGAIYDRLYLAQDGIYVPTWETFCADVSGVDKLNFPAELVQDLVDATGTRYVQGRDFVLDKGRVRWVGNHPISPDPKTGKGTVCTARYLYRPYWYVQRMPHEVRVARADFGDGTAGVQRMAQHLILQREWLFEAELAPSPTSAASPPISARQAPGPKQGSFGAR